jgi:hypothetical protein
MVYGPVDMLLGGIAIMVFVNGTASRKVVVDSIRSPALISKTMARTLCPNNRQPRITNTHLKETPLTM